MRLREVKSRDCVVPADLGRMVAGACLVLATAVSVGLAQSPAPEVMENAKKATVLVFTASSKQSEGDTPKGSGTGFFVNATGLALTNNHVVDPGHGKSEEERFKVVYETGRLVWTVVTDSGTDDEQIYRAQVLYQNEQADMAVMQVEDEDGEFLKTPHFLRFRPSKEVGVQMKAWCLGFPGGDQRRTSDDNHPVIAVTMGNVVKLPRSATGRLIGIVTDVLANPGNSGGPFIDVDGRLVGITTLAGQAEARSATTILIPADLTLTMIQRAFRRQRIPSGVDISPFYDLFVSDDRTWSLPKAARPDRLTCVTFNSGTRVCGSFVEKTMKWASPLGDIAVPTSAMAYVMVDDEHATVFLDGGDRFRVGRESRFMFTPEGGTGFPVDLEEVSWISFPRPAERPAWPEGPAFVIGGDDFHLSILGLSGNVRFRSDFGGGGVLEVPAMSLERIDSEDSDRILSLKNGSRIIGRFESHELTGRLAWSGTPVKFSFEDIDRAAFRLVDYQEVGQSREINLSESLSTSDPRLVRIAHLLDTRDMAAAGPLLEELLQDRAYRSLAASKKDQVRFLQGEHLLRMGEFARSIEVFRTLRRAKDQNVRWHARARLMLLERFPDGMFENASIDQTEVFGRAARSLAAELRREAGHGLDGIEESTPDARSEYLKLLRQGEKVEEKLLIANRLTGGVSDEYLVRLWRVTGRLHGVEIRRLEEARQELAERREGPGPGGRELTERRRRQIDQKIARSQRDTESATEAYAELQAKIQEAGFIIDDPDFIQGRDD